MRVHSPLDAILRGRGTLHVLRQFCLWPGHEFSAPELARLGGLALSHVQGALALLEAQGLVDRHIRGRSHFWSLEDDNVLIGPLRTLFDVENAASEELNHDLKAGLGKLPLRRAVLFGSIARGGETGYSDVDLFLEVVSEQDRDLVLDRLVPLVRRVRGKFGLNLSPLVVNTSGGIDKVSLSLEREIDRDGINLLGGR